MEQALSEKWVELQKFTVFFLHRVSTARQNVTLQAEKLSTSKRRNYFNVTVMFFGKKKNNPWVFQIENYKPSKPIANL
jgi:flagellar biosynthesis regulator FlbT